LPKLFGFKGSHGDFWERSGHFFSHLRETNTASLLLGLGALALLLLGKRFLKNKPVSLFVVIAGIIVASSMDLGSLGVKLLGQVPGVAAIRTQRSMCRISMISYPWRWVVFFLAWSKQRPRVLIKATIVLTQAGLLIASANVLAGLGHGFPLAAGCRSSWRGGGARTVIRTILPY
jgi:hypothetical protein